MAWGNVFFDQNIILDEDAFTRASGQFDELAKDMNTLTVEINNLLDELATGFDTPAGHKFIKSCRDKLIEPMRDQSLVIKHVSENLTQARAQYESVFTEYETLNSMLNKE